MKLRILVRVLCVVLLLVSVKVTAAAGAATVSIADNTEVDVTLTPLGTAHDDSPPAESPGDATSPGNPGQEPATATSQVWWPGRRWSKASPEAVGLSAAKVDAYLSWLTAKAGGEPFGTVVIRQGRMAVEHYGSGATRASVWEIGSIRKAVGSALLGMAIDEQRLTLQTLACDVWPEILAEPEQQKDRSITVKQLFNSTSGWKRPEAPGTRWVYNNAAFTAGGMVLARVYQLPEDRLAPWAQTTIADPIGASSWRCYHYPAGFTASDRNPGPKLAVDSNLEDLARFGYLWLREGEWNGKQIIPRTHITEATRNQASDAGGHYGFCWFINDGQEMLPAAPGDAYFHGGNGKDSRRTVLAVIPSLDLVAVVGTHAARYDITRDWTPQGAPNANEWISRILASLRDTQNPPRADGASDVSLCP